MIGTTLSHYKILEKIGQGGMGEVFLADDLSLGRKVALKFLPQDLQRDPTAHKRLLREAKSAAARSDIFSFGIMLYEMLTGIHPYKKETGVETLSAILSEAPLPLGRHLPQAPELLQQVVGKMLAKEPDQRYQSMHEIRTDLRQILQQLESAIPAAPRPGILRLPRSIRSTLMIVAFGVEPGRNYGS